MKQESALESVTGNAAFRTASLPFSAVPGQSRLFLEYLRDPFSLKNYYPNAVEKTADIDAIVPQVLANYSTNRDELCDALAEINAGGSGETLANIERLRDAGTVAVVTGQQAGLFTGPLYTIYKAISAIKMAETMTTRGVNAVPVFWIATEDHDFDEVSEASFFGESGKLVRTVYRPNSYHNESPVGDVKIDADIDLVIDNICEDLPKTEFSDEARQLLSRAWGNGSTFGRGFVETLSSLLGKFGLVLIDPLNVAVKRLAAPIYVEAIKNADAITEAVRTRSRELEAEGYQAQVAVEENYFPLFWHDDAGRRTALRKVRDGVYSAKGEKREFTVAELEGIAAAEPSRFSPGVMLRPVVQDFLLPTACYFGGGAEIAYFAQNSEVYRILDRPATPIMHRQSFTVVEPKPRRAMEKLGLEFSDLFDGLETLRLRAAENNIGPETARVFDEAEDNINAELNRLDQTVSQIDVTVGDNLSNRRRKIAYHIAALRKKTLLAQVRKDETMNRRIDSVYSSLYPNMHLQERVVNVFTYINKYGMNFIDWIYDVVDLDDRGHRIVNL